jgi:hypothetical protein
MAANAELIWQAYCPRCYQVAINCRTACCPNCHGPLSFHPLKCSKCGWVAGPQTCLKCAAIITDKYIFRVKDEDILAIGSTPSIGKCPKCSSQKTTHMVYPHSGVIFGIIILLSFFTCFIPLILFGCFIFLTPNKKCLECGNEWK